MWISRAYAQSVEIADEIVGQDVDAPGVWEAFGWNMLMVVILVVLFYVLMIVPQQKRLKDHRNMLNDLKKGDPVIISSGLIGRIEKIKDDSEDVTVRLADGLNVVALKSALQKHDRAPDPANDSGKTNKKKSKKSEKKNAQETDAKSDLKTDKKKSQA